MPGRPPRMGCSGCWPPPTGTRTWSATTCAPSGGAPGRPTGGAGGGRDRLSKEGDDLGGVQRQYSGTAGKVDNCQLGVFLAYAGPKGRAFIDRELYLPRAWTNDPARCRAARIPEQVGFRTKPQLARMLLERALDAEVPASWVTADEVDGGDPALRVWLEGRDMAYVLAIRGTEPLAIPGPDGAARVSAEQLAAG